MLRCITLEYIDLSSLMNLTTIGNNFLYDCNKLGKIILGNLKNKNIEKKITRYINNIEKIEII
jgi:hypothetical protein